MGIVFVRTYVTPITLSFLRIFIMSSHSAPLFSFIILFRYEPIFDEVQDVNTPEELKSWLELEFVKKSRAKCLFLIGPSKLGKTHWARSIAQPHTYWKTMVNLDEWNPEGKLVIFDDFEKWEFMPNPKGYLTQAGQCTVTDKYRKKRTINVNMPAIFICNNMPMIGGTPLDMDDYWKENGCFVRVLDKLY